MIKTNTSKVVAAVIGFTMALTVFAAVGATAASAQSMNLSQLVDLFIQMGIISPDKAAAAKAAVTSSASVTFTKDLTVGSRGADVTALQNALGVTSTGYFGSVTKAAVVSYQKAHGLPATGYVGALTRAALNGSSSMNGGGTMPPVTPPGTPAVNSGVEGILTVDSSAVSNSTVYVGQTNVPLIAFKATSKLSPINIERVKIDVGTTTTFYTKVFKTVYLEDQSGKVIAQADLNSNTVVKTTDTNGNTVYEITLGGFSYTVPKDASVTFTVAGDVYSSVDTSYQRSWTVTIPASGVRGTDGAGIDQYSNGALTQTLTVNSSLVDSAQLLVSADAANFLGSDVVAAAGSANNQYDKLPLLAFDLRAQKDQVEITDLTATINGKGVATSTAAYLYDGSTLLASASVNGSTGVAKFTNINYWVPQDTTKVLTLKADIRSAGTSASTFSATIANSGPVAQNSQGSSVSPSGSATGNNFIVRSVGPVFTLNSASPVKSATASNNNTSTSTVDATFNLTIQAVGGNIYFGSQAGANTFDFAVYQNGVKTTLSTLAVATSTAWSNPSTGAVTSGLSGGSSFEIPQNNSVTLPVDFTFTGRTTAGSLVPVGSYSVGLEGVTWNTSDSGTGSTTSTFMSGQTAWRTTAVSLP